MTTKLVALGLCNPSVSVTVTGNGHGRLPSPRLYMIEVIGARGDDGLIRRGIKLLSTNEIAE